MCARMRGTHTPHDEGGTHRFTTHDITTHPAKLGVNQTTFRSSSATLLAVGYLRVQDADTVLTSGSVLTHGLRSLALSPLSLSHSVSLRVV
jgi:hypothetical protein